ncbi:MAG: Spy/CpxP family protein refolding chaperone [Methylocella sp.]
MNKFWSSLMRRKTLFAGTIALVLASSCLAYAQQSPTGDKVSALTNTRRLPLEDRAAVVDARIVALKAGLKLTPDQEKNWPPYEAALRTLAKLRVERYREQKSANPVELLRQRAEDLGSASAALKQLADAEEPLFNSLDDAQKHRLGTFARIARDRRARIKG